jgi:hypothetical protein
MLDFEGTESYKATEGGSGLLSAAKKGASAC